MLNIILIVSSINIILSQNITTNSTNITNNTLENNNSTQIFCIEDIDCLSCYNKQCRLCNINNKKVLNPTINKCESLKYDISNCIQYDYNNKCLKCNYDYYLINNKCYKISIDILLKNENCEAFIVNNNEFICDYCKPLYYKLDNNKCSLIEKNHILNCEYYDSISSCKSCLVGYTLMSNQCIKIDKISNCLYYQGLNYYCDKCINTNYKYTYILNNNYLADEYLNNNIRNYNTITYVDNNGKIKFYNNDNVNICKNLEIQNCEISNANYCLTCKTGYYLNSNFECVMILKSKTDNCFKYQYITATDIICIECNKEYYLDNIKKVCILRKNNKNCYTLDKYYDNCLQCNIYYILKNDNCELLGSYKLIDFCLLTDNNYNDRCIKCIQGYTLNNFDSTCFKSINNCILYTNNKCSQCDYNNGYILNINTNSCVYNSIKNCVRLNQNYDKCLECTNAYKPNLSGTACESNFNNYFCLNTEIINSSNFISYNCSKCVVDYFFIQSEYCPVKVTNCYYYNTDNTCKICDGVYDNGCHNKVNLNNNCLKTLATDNSKCALCDVGYYVNSSSLCERALNKNDCSKQSLINGQLVCIACVSPDKVIYNVNYCRSIIEDKYKLSENYDTDISESCLNNYILREFSTTYGFCDASNTINYSTITCLLQLNSICIKCKRGYRLNESTNVCDAINNCIVENNSKILCKNCVDNSYTLSPYFNCIKKDTITQTNNRDFSDKNCKKTIEVVIDGNNYILCTECNYNYILKDIHLNKLKNDIFYYQKNNSFKDILEFLNQNEEEYIIKESKDNFLLAGECTHIDNIKLKNGDNMVTSSLYSINKDKILLVDNSNVILLCISGYIYNNIKNICEIMYNISNTYMLTGLINKYKVIFNEEYYCSPNYYLTILNNDIKCLEKGDSNVNKISTTIQNCLVYLHDGTANANNTLCKICKKYYYLNESTNLCENSILYCNDMLEMIGLNNKYCINCKTKLKRNNECYTYAEIVAFNNNINNCLYYLNNNTCLKCFDGYSYYKEITNGITYITCKIIDYNINNCFVYSINGCDQCLNNNIIINTATNSIKKCVYNQNSYTNCMIITQNNDCKQCLNNYTISEDKKNCFNIIYNCEIALDYVTKKCNKCKNNYYLNSNNECIIGQIEGCDIYKDKDNCLQCLSNYYLYINTLTNKQNCYKIDFIPDCNLKNNLLFDGTLRCTCNNGVTSEIYPERRCIPYRRNDIYITNILNNQLYNNSKLLNTFECKDTKLYYDNQLDMCVNKSNINNCLMINSLNKCELCANGYFLNTTLNICEINPTGTNDCINYDKNICIECKQHYYLNKISNTCEKIADINIVINCKEYSSLNKCNICDRGYFLVNNICEIIKFNDNLSLCNLPYLSINECTCSKYSSFNKMLNKCEKIDNCISFKPNSLIAECTDCEQNYYLDILSNTCRIKEYLNIDYCIKYDINGLCIECDGSKGFYLYLGICIQINKTINNCRTYKSGNKCIYCYYGYYLTAASVCEICSEGCAYCDSNRNCKICKPGYYQKYENKCEKINY